jgi:D-hexose-6-phosphate mutarotase
LNDNFDAATSHIVFPLQPLHWPSHARIHDQLLRAGSLVRQMSYIGILAAGSLTINDAGPAPRKTVIKTTGFDDAVVWNPWTEKARALADFGDDEYKCMVCVEPANAATYLSGGSVEVAPACTWAGTQSIHVEPLSVS